MDIPLLYKLDANGLLEQVITKVRDRELVLYTPLELSRSIVPIKLRIAPLVASLTRY